MSDSQSKDLVPRPAERATRIDNSEELRLGLWYWVENPKDTKHPRWLGCLVTMGSNFVELEGPDPDSSDNTFEFRIHLEDLSIKLTLEPNADQIMAGKARDYQETAGLLLKEVQELTMRLGVSNQLRLGDSPEGGGSSTALVAVTGHADVTAYKKSLIEAKEKTLPKLFEEIQEATEMSAHWMKGALIPLQAQAGMLKKSTDSIEGRIFNVELYAGLTETVVKVREGEPAPFHERLRLMQRKLFMDEECVAGYLLGGIDIETLEDFDKWLTHPDNFKRVLPFPRCMVAFQVRRESREREWGGDLHQLFINLELKDLDKLSFLYIRNGEQVFRLQTSLEFGELIFPDRGEFSPDEPLMAKQEFREWEIITRRDWESQQQAQKDRVKARRLWFKENPYREWRKAQIAEEVAAGHDPKKVDPNKWLWEQSNPHKEFPRFFEKEWHSVDPSSVYYDDVMGVIKGRIDQYNRVALIIQGLFDRSSVLHPHPPVRLSDPASFEQAVELIYDSDRALYPAAQPPDYEVYREALSKSITPGSLVVGAHSFYKKLDRQRAEEKFNRSWRSNGRFYYGGFRQGDRGPGLISRVVRLKKGGTVAVFEWPREALDRSGWPLRDRTDPVTARVEVPVKDLLHVDAYKSGDWRQFFQDPRTREDYLQWAPVLLAAEECKSGRLKAGEPPPRHIWVDEVGDDDDDEGEDS